MSELDSKKQAIASRLRIARERAGLSQGQVAKLLGLHRPSVSELEAGRRRVSAEELATLSELYGVGVDWLSGVDQKETDAFRDRIELAARELAKLRREDLDAVLDLLKALHKSGK